MINKVCMVFATCALSIAYASDLEMPDKGKLKTAMVKVCVEGDGRPGLLAVVEDLIQSPVIDKFAGKKSNVVSMGREVKEIFRAYYKKSEGSVLGGEMAFSLLMASFVSGPAWEELVRNHVVVCTP